jgi:hypothetical protein
MSGWLKAQYDQEKLKEKYTEEQVAIINKFEEIEQLVGIEETATEEAKEVKDLTFEQHILHELDELQKNLEARLK